MAEIKIKNVAKNFASYQALSDINLTVSDQEFMVLLGASGCGKNNPIADHRWAWKLRRRARCGSMIEG
jgi:ABC-type transporter Mla maintaining outer membrane lipid asymmetry ATPase subunit MlaF